MKKITSLLALFLVVLGINAQTVEVSKNLDRSAWKVKTDSWINEGAGGGNVTHAIDGKNDTYWHSSWQDGAGTGVQVLPHHMVVDLGAACEFDKFSVLPRQNNDNGKIKGYKFFVSNTADVFNRTETADLENNADWELVKEGELSFTGKEEVSVDLGKICNARYVKLYVSSNHGSDGKFVTLAEFNLSKKSVGVQVTYNYEFEGKVIRTEKVNQALNDSAYVPAELAYMDCKLENPGVVSADNYTFKVVCFEKLPFVKSVSVEAANWYIVDMHANDTGNPTYYWTVEGEKPFVKKMTGRDDLSMKGDANYYWCFIGDVVNGFKIVNKATGKALTNATDPASLVAIADAPLWKLAKSRQVEGGTCFTVDGKNYLNKQTVDGVHELKFWSDVDGGSSCRFFTDQQIEDNILISKSEKLIANAKGYMNLPVGAVGSSAYFATSAAQYEAAVKALEENKADAELYAALEKEYKAASEAEKVAFDASKLYRIKNYCRDLSVDNGVHAYEGGYMGDNLLVGDSVGCHTKSMADATCVWAFEKSGEFYMIKNLNSGKYIGKTAKNASTYLAQVAEAAEAGLYTMTDLGNAQFKFTCSNGEGDHKDLHASGIKKDGPGVMNWNADANSASAWFVIPAETLEVNMNKVDSTASEAWASLYLPFDVTLPEGVEAYIGAVNDDATAFNLTKVADVPANTGVVLKGTAEKYTLNLAAASADVEMNMFQGSNVQQSLVFVDPDYPEDGEMVLNSQFLVLGNGDNGVGLYNPSGNVLKANKAYFRSMATPFVSSLKFVFDEVTGVEGVEVETENANAVYYDLSGRRVAHPVKGVYVKNGKKVYVK